jgi:hypothetical protein
LVLELSDQGQLLLIVCSLGGSCTSHSWARTLAASSAWTTDTGSSAAALPVPLMVPQTAESLVCSTTTSTSVFTANPGCLFGSHGLTSFRRVRYHSRARTGQVSSSFCLRKMHEVLFPSARGDPRHVGPPVFRLWTIVRHGLGAHCFQKARPTRGSIPCAHNSATFRPIKERAMAASRCTALRMMARS